MDKYTFTKSNGHRIALWPFWRWETLLDDKAWMLLMDLIITLCIVAALYIACGWI